MSDNVRTQRKSDSEFLHWWSSSWGTGIQSENPSFCGIKDRVKNWQNFIYIFSLQWFQWNKLRKWIIKKKLIESYKIHKYPAKIYGETIEYETGISVSSRASVDSAIARTIIVAFSDFKTPIGRRWLIDDPGSMSLRSGQYKSQSAKLDQNRFLQQGWEAWSTIIVWYISAEQ